MPPDLTPPITLAALLPELVVLTAGCVALLLGQAATRAAREAIPWVCFIGLALALAVLRFGGDPSVDGEIRSGLLMGPLAHFVRLAALILGAVILLVSWSQPSTEEAGEFFSMAMFSLCGLMLVGAAADLVVLFMALELVSIPTYVMVALSRRGLKPLEAGTKYFYLGALAAAITAYGFTFLYGVAGGARMDATAINNIAAALNTPGTTAYALATIGVVVSIGGLLFKIAAVPLHFYIADVYEGAASPVAGLLGFVPKLAGLAAIFAIAGLTDWRTTSGGLFWLLWIVAGLSMTVGNVLALRQTNVKRLLAYSGIAHSGYMLVGILAGPDRGIGAAGDGLAAVLYYAVVYGIANLGAFALLGLLQVRGAACETVRDLAGLVRRHPGPALLMALAMMTLMGLPPAPGFWGKLSLFGSALAVSREAPPESSSWLVALVIIAVINTAIGAAYYLRVIAAVLLYEAERTAEPAPREAQHIGATLCGFLLLMFSFFPSVLLNAGRHATLTLRENRAIVLAPPEQASPPRTQRGAELAAETP